jgi:glucan phosphoethanolaminetransferase (alkaline phosphatase superfamily)
MKNILLLMGIFMCGGSPFLVLTLWNIIKPQSSPKQLYILSLNSILLCAAILMGVLFFTNKKVKDIIFRH